MAVGDHDPVKPPPTKPDIKTLNILQGAPPHDQCGSRKGEVNHRQTEDVGCS